MKYTSGLGLTMSGSLGGVTASRNKGGQYLRRRAIPTNPNSDSQQGVRNRLTTAATAYRSLNAGQVESWRTYADNTPIVDSLGVSKKLTPSQWFISYATTYQQAGRPIPYDAPTVSGRADEVAVTAAGIDGTDLSITISPAIVAGQACLVFISRPQSAGVVFYKGPFRFLYAVGLGSTLVVTASDLPFPLAVGDNVFIRTVFVEKTTDGGRTSTGNITPAILTAI
jgi:hypothetical protein